jgi:hypothetical protein
MRFVVSVLAAVSVGGLSLALADPPAPASATTGAASSSTNATQPAAPASAPTAAQPAAKSATASSSTPAADPREERLLSQGYRPQMHDGQKVFCKRAAILGSRTEMTTLCGTVDQLSSQIQNSREATENAQRTQLPVSGH